MDTHLQNRLQQFTAPPPKEAWNKIAAALDAAPSFAQKLQQYKEAPPAGCWPAIEQGLNEPAATVVPFSARFKKTLRYVAAASLLATIALTLTLTLRRTEAGPAQAGKDATGSFTQEAAAYQPTGTLPKDSARDVLTATPPQTAPDALTKNIPPVAGLPIQKKRRVTQATIAPLPAGSRYVLFRDGDGQVRKISKKLADFIHCQNDDCRQHLKEVRQKMASEAMMTDFTSLLELVRQLQQKP